MNIGFWWESQTEGDHWEDLDEGRRIRLINMIEQYGVV
jgi:hypothetical protein